MLVAARLPNVTVIAESSFKEIGRDEKDHLFPVGRRGCWGLLRGLRPERAGSQEGAIAVRNKTGKRRRLAGKREGTSEARGTQGRLWDTVRTRFWEQA